MNTILKDDQCHLAGPVSVTSSTTSTQEATRGRDHGHRLRIAVGGVNNCSAESHLDDRGSVLHGAAVHVARVELGDVPVHPGAHLGAPVGAELHRGHVGVGVVQADEGGGGAGLGVLDYLPVVLGAGMYDSRRARKMGTSLLSLSGYSRILCVPVVTTRSRFSLENEQRRGKRERRY